MAIRDIVKQQVQDHLMENLEKIRLNNKALEKLLLLCDLVEMFDNPMDELEEYGFGIDDTGRHGILSMALVVFSIEDESISAGAISKQVYCKYIINADSLKFDQNPEGLVRIQHLVKNLWIPVEEWDEWKKGEGLSESSTSEES